MVVGPARRGETGKTGKTGKTGMTGDIGVVSLMCNVLQVLTGGCISDATMDMTFLGGYRFATGQHQFLGQVDSDTCEYCTCTFLIRTL